MAEFTNKLNRRHKAALCSTLICVGLILLLGGAVRPAVGVGLLGLAFSWALGSNKRIVHWLFVICGLLLLVPAVGDVFMWPRVKPGLIEGHTRLIEDDQDMIKSIPSLITQMTQQEQREAREELSKAYHDLAKDEQELRSLQAEGIFRHVVKEDWGSGAGGLLLLSAGLGLLFGVKPVRQDQS